METGHPSDLPDTEGFRRHERVPGISVVYVHHDPAAYSALQDLPPKSPLDRTKPMG